MKNRNLVCQIILTAILVISIICTFFPMLEMNAFGVSLSLSFADLFQEDSLLENGMDILGEAETLNAFKTVIALHISINLIIGILLWFRKRYVYRIIQVLSIFQFVWWIYVVSVWKNQFSTGNDFLDSFYEVQIGVGVIGYIITAIMVVIFAGVLALINNTNKFDKTDSTDIENNVDAEKTVERAKEGAIVWISGEYVGARIIINNMPVVLGRDKNSCQLVFEGRNISRQHCSIEYNAKKNVYLICDFSSNGTFIVDEKRLPKNETIEIISGKKIQIGDDNVFVLE